MHPDLMHLKRYDQDGLETIHNHEFMDDPAFQAAYQRGVQAVGLDYNWHWRVHVGLWAAHNAHFLEGDFVECGVNKGFLSSAIMKYLNWNKLGKNFWLMDTFAGLDERYVTESELKEGILEKNEKLLKDGWYTNNFEEVRHNFNEWNNVRFVKGAIPDTLPEVGANKICFLHIDLNCAPPEVEAIRFFWEKLVPGAVVLLDDYAYYGYRNQKLAMDDFASSKNVQILSLPTGQGLLLRPPFATL